MEALQQKTWKQLTTTRLCKWERQNLSNKIFENNEKLEDYR